MYIFNPEHDICLANGDPNFVPPRSALEFGEECTGLPRWVAEAERLRQSPPGTDASEKEFHLREIIPWGWNPVIKRRLQKAGVPDDILPAAAELEAIRTLSHRRNAIDAKEFIKREIGSGMLTGTAMEMTSCEEAAAAIETLSSTVLKAPWSGSGKGLRWVRRGEFHPSDRGWCERTIARQGSIITEKRERVVQDFAMLFRITRQNVQFAGYSLFFSENGMYRANLLASDNNIVSRLAQYVPAQILRDVRISLTRFLTERFAGKYDGFVGADMFICEGEKAGEYLLNPCVELNVRMTMGLLARAIYDLNATVPERFAQVLEECSGCTADSTRTGADRTDLKKGEHHLKTVYFPRRGDLAAYIRQTGAVPVHRVTEESRYGVVIIL